ncbi:hypothetical protein Tco_0628149 [Tanacetum coccineum]|uniref:Uncharacterized protein n=1 Tax=Tanacetum coccineum TaxID=301880 RepID=A0ABQ4WPI0_9ASTR
MFLILTQFLTLDVQITQLIEKINVLQEQNELFRAENGKIKQHYKELYDTIKITHAKHLEETTALLTDNESLKVQIQNKLSCVNKDQVKPKVLAPGKYAIDVEPIHSRNRNNREVLLAEAVATACYTGTDNQEKDEKQRQNDKTGLGMEKTVKDKAKSKPESQSSQKVNRKVNWSKSKSTQVNPGAKVKEI